MSFNINLNTVIAVVIVALVVFFSVRDIKGAVKNERPYQRWKRRALEQIAGEWNSIQTEDETRGDLRILITPYGVSRYFENAMLVRSITETLNRELRGKATIHNPDLESAWDGTIRVWFDTKNNPELYRDFYFRLTDILFGGYYMHFLSTEDYPRLDEVTKPFWQPFGRERAFKIEGESLVFDEVKIRHTVRQEFIR